MRSWSFRPPYRRSACDAKADGTMRVDAAAPRRGGQHAHAASNQQTVRRMHAAGGRVQRLQLQCHWPWRHEIDAEKNRRGSEPRGDSAHTRRQHRPHRHTSNKYMTLMQFTCYAPPGPPTSSESHAGRHLLANDAADTRSRPWRRRPHQARRAAAARQGNTAAPPGTAHASARDAPDDDAAVATTRRIGPKPDHGVFLLGCLAWLCARLCGSA
jgi:hypothetical protein